EIRGDRFAERGEILDHGRRPTFDERFRERTGVRGHSPYLWCSVTDRCDDLDLRIGSHALDIGAGGWDGACEQHRALRQIVQFARAGELVNEVAKTLLV